LVNKQNMCKTARVNAKDALENEQPVSIHTITHISII